MPTSVVISRKAKETDAIPNNPNCNGFNSLASNAIFTNDIILKSSLKAAIQVIPLIVFFK